MSQVFKHKECVQLYHVDGASLLFYGQLFFLLHNAFAAFLKKLGFSINEIIKKQEFFFPVVHAEANYSKPVFVGAVLEINLWIEKIGESSFTVLFELYSNESLIGDAKIVHATIDAKKQKKINIPKEFKGAIQSYLKKDV